MERGWGDTGSLHCIPGHQTRGHTRGHTSGCAGQHVSPQGRAGPLQAVAMVLPARLRVVVVIKKTNQRHWGGGAEEEGFMRRGWERKLVQHHGKQRRGSSKS